MESGLEEAEMNVNDKLVFEDTVMGLAAYIRALAVVLDRDRSREIDGIWQEFKWAAGRRFSEWHS